VRPFALDFEDNTNGTITMRSFIEGVKTCLEEYAAFKGMSPLALGDELCPNIAFGLRMGRIRTFIDLPTYPALPPPSREHDPEDDSGEAGEAFEEVAVDLPLGWKVQWKGRQKSSDGRHYKIYIAPDGKSFRSKKKALEAAAEAAAAVSGADTTAQREAALQHKAAGKRKRVDPQGCAVAIKTEEEAVRRPAVGWNRKAAGVAAPVTPVPID